MNNQWNQQYPGQQQRQIPQQQQQGQIPMQQQQGQMPPAHTMPAQGQQYGQMPLQQGQMQLMQLPMAPVQAQMPMIAPFPQPGQLPPVLQTQTPMLQAQMGQQQGQGQPMSMAQQAQYGQILAPTPGMMPQQLPMGQPQQFQAQPQQAQMGGQPMSANQAQVGGPQPPSYQQSVQPQLTQAQIDDAIADRIWPDDEYLNAQERADLVRRDVEYEQRMQPAFGRQVPYQHGPGPVPAPRGPSVESCRAPDGSYVCARCQLAWEGTVYGRAEFMRHAAAHRIFLEM